MNILLITIDSLRADFVNYYNLSRLPKELERYKNKI